MTHNLFNARQSFTLANGKQGITHNVECAPGKVLAGLNKRIDANQQALAINDGEALKLALAALA